MTISLNVTANKNPFFLGMLVIASLFVSTSSSLPQTSYMKLIDVWMIFCFLLPFIEVILHTMVEYCTDDEEEEEKEKEKNRR